MRFFLLSNKLWTRINRARNWDFHLQHPQVSKYLTKIILQSNIDSTQPLRHSARRKQRSNQIKSSLSSYLVKRWVEKLEQRSRITKHVLTQKVKNFPKSCNIWNSQDWNRLTMKAQKHQAHSVCHTTCLTGKKLRMAMSLVIPMELNQERKMKV